MCISNRTQSRRNAILAIAGCAVVQQPLHSRPGNSAGEARTFAEMRFRWCPAGRFRMGSPSYERLRQPDEAQVTVTLSKGFWIGECEVTQGDWARHYGAFPRPMDKGRGDDFPIYWVNYFEAETFCLRLTAHALAAGRLDRNWHFRLPTEAQWEYACRAGTTTATIFGDSLFPSQANFGGEPYREPFNIGPRGMPPGQATKVGSYPANAWGILDMHGNIFEWCRDWYHHSLPGGVDPDLSTIQGTMNRDGTYSRVRRGGAWAEDGRMCRSSQRLRYEPHRSSDHIGFRVVIEPRKDR